MSRTFAVAATLAVIALLGASYYLTTGKSSGEFAQCKQGSVAGGASAIGGPFTLVNGAGETVTSEEVLTKPSLIYFGYTFCPDVCPLDVARNAVAVEILEEEGIEVQPVFISIDPERDTPEVVADFVAAQHPAMVGLTGSPEQVKAASQAYRTFYSKQPAAPGEEAYYLVDHTTFTYLTLPERGFVEFFRRDLGPEAMAEQVACFVNAS